jgi:hypothetical protein
MVVPAPTRAVAVVMAMIVSNADMGACADAADMNTHADLGVRRSHCS